MENFQTLQGFGEALESSFVISMHVPHQIVEVFHTLGVAGAVGDLLIHFFQPWGSWSCYEAFVVTQGLLKAPKEYFGA